MSYYESERSKRKIWNTIKSDEEKTIEMAIKKGFPNCKGTYPDCPEKPSRDNEKCRNCPVLEAITDKEMGE